MPQIGAAVALTLGQSSSIPTRLGNAQIIAGLGLQNLSGYALQVAFGTFQMWIPPFCAGSMPQSQLGDVGVTPVNVGAVAGAGLNYVLPTYYLAGDVLPAPGALVAAPLPVELVGVIGGVTVPVVGASGANFSEIHYDTSQYEALIVTQVEPRNVTVYEGSLATTASETLIAAAAGKGIFLRYIFVGCDNAATAGDGIVLHFGITAGDNSVAVASSPTGAAFPPTVYPFDNLLVDNAENKALVLTNASSITVDVRITVIYTQSAFEVSAGGVLP